MCVCALLLFFIRLCDLNLNNVHINLSNGNRETWFSTYWAWCRMLPHQPPNFQTITVASKGERMGKKERLKIKQGIMNALCTTPNTRSWNCERARARARLPIKFILKEFYDRAKKMTTMTMKCFHCG